MMPKASTLIEVLATFNQLKQLAALLDLANPDGRWNALQDWLKRNPKLERKLNQFLNLTPAEATDKILESFSDEWRIPIAALADYDPGGQVRQITERTIEQIQTLYRDRQLEDLIHNPPIIELPPPKRRRSRKAA